MTIPMTPAMSPNRGWVCPVCGAGLAPHVTVCPNDTGKTTTVSTLTYPTTTNPGGYGVTINTASTINRMFGTDITPLSNAPQTQDEKRPCEHSWATDWANDEQYCVACGARRHCGGCGVQR